MRKAITVVCLLIAMAVNAQTAAELVEKAMDKGIKKKYDESLDLFDQAIKKGPVLAKYYLFKSYTLMAMGRINEGNSLMETTLKNYADSDYVYLFTAHFFHDMTDYNRGTEVIDMGFKKFPALSDTMKRAFYSIRGGCKLKVQDYQGFYNDALSMYNMDTTSLNAMIDLALALQLLPKIDEAIDMYKRIIAKDPTNAYMYNNLGFLYDENGRYQEALDLLDEGLRRENPKDPNYERGMYGYMHSNRGFAKFKLGDTKGALKDFEKGIEMAPTNSYVYKNRALTYISMRKFDEACKDLNTAIMLGYSERYGDQVDKLSKLYCK